MKRFEREMIQGFLHEPGNPNGNALGLTHGAGGNCEQPTLVAVADAFAEAGWVVLRYDLPFRQEGKGAPGPAKAARDREGIRRVAAALREFAKGRIALSGSSYGGRQSTMAAAEDPKLADGLLLLSYPLHPPGKPEKLRTEHFPNLQTPAMFAHGTRDAFGTIEELTAAIKLIPARTELVAVDKAPHGLPGKIATWLPQRFTEFLG
jgi:predicted alpha/beta-hydrolase family hydrolase